MRDLGEHLPLRVTLHRIGEPTPAERLLASSQIDSARRIATFWRRVVAARPDFEPEKEQLVVIALNANLTPKAYHLVSVGTVNALLAHPREHPSAFADSNWLGRLDV